MATLGLYHGRRNVRDRDRGIISSTATVSSAPQPLLSGKACHREQLLLEMGRCIEIRDASAIPMSSVSYRIGVLTAF